MLINPYYAIQFDETLFGEHPLLVDEATWIKAQQQLLAELGPDAYFRRLLKVLKGDSDQPEPAE
jgi:hypothetical protein